MWSWVIPGAVQASPLLRVKSARNLGRARPVRCGGKRSLARLGMAKRCRMKGAEIASDACRLFSGSDCNAD
jgi:hypothetical protein